MVDVPVIETGRLRLRAHRPDDFDACAAMWASPEVTRFTGGRPFTPEESWARLLRFHGHWVWFGYGFWAIEDRATGVFAGHLGFAEFRRAVDPPVTLPEAGWSLAPAFHGRGYATEALTAALVWADAGLPGHGTQCIIDPDNAPSIRVAERCGYRRIARAQYKNGPTTLFERLRP